ncbi:hypothetical protein DFH09DRAFT_154580 [Mycena vulgaris]|nr:hypothetical protein DFH09DRAFT_154580 [Mycena vulgaris]
MDGIAQVSSLPRTPPSLPPPPSPPSSSPCHSSSPSPPDVSPAAVHSHRHLFSPTPTPVSLPTRIPLFTRRWAHPNISRCHPLLRAYCQRDLPPRHSARLLRECGTLAISPRTRFGCRSGRTVAWRHGHVTCHLSCAPRELRNEVDISRVVYMGL